MSEIKTSSRTLSGRIVSDKMDKTITVLVERRVKHPVYGKILTKSSKIKAHDDSNDASMGDLVTIAECRPVSKDKAWKLINIDERATAE
ncbi:MAG: 30S ribosomal protein S17 [Porticoccaceae bacterium]|jgi:small subunit ribosomal protein S17|nr:30S ribosomal protein S17 [Porticoccaceae bacterium]PDH31819.1 MAG: 30S ribosomal protein S17 [SAR92 bacterium MED-G29]|tara:strand:- start:437 stop:703 length:267 start_codon:yes stop_codon:yes gene_type:complete